MTLRHSAAATAAAAADLAILIIGTALFAVPFGLVALSPFIMGL